MPFYRNVKSTGGGSANVGPYNQPSNVSAIGSVSANAYNYGYDGFNQLNILPASHNSNYGSRDFWPSSHQIDLSANHNNRYLTVKAHPEDYESVVLWTNDSPDSSFNTGKVTNFPYPVARYQFIEVVCKNSTTDSDTKSVFFDPRIFPGSGNYVCQTSQIGQYDDDSSSSYPGVWTRGFNTYNSHADRCAFSLGGHTRRYIRGMANTTGNTRNIPMMVIAYYPKYSNTVYKELWRNYYPTQSFSKQTINLSSSYRNYNYITFVWTTTTTSGCYGLCSMETYSSSEVYYFDANEGNIIGCLGQSGKSGTSNGRVRWLYYTGSSSIGISNCINAPTSSSATCTVVNTDVIPVAVIGSSEPLLYRAEWEYYLLSNQ
jgi:hypothetical protein